MKFEEVLSALRDGKKITNEHKKKSVVINIFIIEMELFLKIMVAIGI